MQNITNYTRFQGLLAEFFTFRTVSLGLLIRMFVFLWFASSGGKLIFDEKDVVCVFVFYIFRRQGDF